MNNVELGKYLARELFKCGDGVNDRCQRIQFKGGDWRAKKETDLGGFGEEPLADWFARALDKAAHSASGDSNG